MKAEFADAAQTDGTRPALHVRRADHSLAHDQTPHVVADRIDDADHLVAQDARRREVRVAAAERLDVRAAESDGAHAKACLVWPGKRNRRHAQRDAPELDQLRDPHFLSIA
jgi:hypothetical protein